MRRLDLSMPLFPGMPSFPGDPPFGLATVRRIDRGDPYNLSRLELGSHAGTHVDPPIHFVAGGTTVDRLDLNDLNGPCEVVQVSGSSRAILPDDVSRIPAGVTRVLFRTRNSERWARQLAFFPDFIGLAPEAAARLTGRGIRLVGIDSLSIENDPSGAFPVHRTLLGAGIPVLEGLLLGEAPAGAAVLECLPLRVRDGDGGPARAVLELA